MGEAPDRGLGMGGADVVRFWDDCADSYSARMQGDIPDRIVRYLSDHSILGPDTDVLEIGSGPGTYSLPLASAAGSITCIDSSQRMLDRLISSASAGGIGNIIPVLGDWNSYASSKRYGMCIATLCPGSGSPESMMRMESVTDGWCVLVSWEVNHGDDMTEMIWKELGKDFDFSVRLRSKAEEWLRDNGRDPVVERFAVRITEDIPTEDLVMRESSVFSAYGAGSDVGDIVRRLVGGDAMHFDEVNTMRLLAWKAGGI